MAGIFDEVMEGINAKESGAAAPPAPPKEDGGGGETTPPKPDAEKKGAFGYGQQFKEKYGERKA
jgi:hypothetical protein